MQSSYYIYNLSKLYRRRSTQGLANSPTAWSSPTALWGPHYEWIYCATQRWSRTRGATSEDIRIHSSYQQRILPSSSFLLQHFLQQLLWWALFYFTNVLLTTLCRHLKTTTTKKCRRTFGIHCAIHIGATVWQESVTWALSRLMHTGWWDYKKTKALLPIGSRPRLQGSQLTRPATLQLPTTRTTSVLCSRMTAVSLCFWGHHSCFCPQALHRTVSSRDSLTRQPQQGLFMSYIFLKIKSLLFSK